MQYHLQVFLQDALLTRDVESFSKMDPYIRFQLEKTQQISKTIVKGGKTPKWNEHFDFLVTESDKIDISVVDAEESAKDRIVGSGVLLVETLVATNVFNEESPLAIPIFWSGKDCGKVNFCWILKQSEKDELVEEVRKERKVREDIEQEKIKLETQILDLLQGQKKLQQKLEEEKHAYIELEKLIEVKSKEVDAKNAASDEVTKTYKNLLAQEKAINQKTLEKLEQEKKALLSETNGKKKEIDELNKVLSTKASEVDGGKKEIDELNKLLNAKPKVSEDKTTVKIGAGVVIGAIVGALAASLLRK